MKVSDQIKRAPKTQLLKWIGNKQSQAETIIKFFPGNFNTYYEPFLGSAAIAATLQPKDGYASDIYSPLIDIWNEAKNNPNNLVKWYSERFNLIARLGKKEAYEEVRDSFNKKPNSADFLFLVRTCYGGVIRFRKEDGYMSTPCGNHDPISVDQFKNRVNEWHPRIKSLNFLAIDYKEALLNAKSGDLIYCDPPYSYSQNILYGAHSFNLEELFTEIDNAKSRGVFIALSIDGKKKSGRMLCNLPIPKNLFEKEVFLNNGSSKLRRFQLEGETTEEELVNDRLLLTYDPT